jgi:hypothetical protein
MLNNAEKYDGRHSELPDAELGANEMAENDMRLHEILNGGVIDVGVTSLPTLAEDRAFLDMVLLEIDETHTAFSDKLTALSVLRTSKDSIEVGEGNVKGKINEFMVQRERLICCYTDLHISCTHRGHVQRAQSSMEGDFVIPCNLAGSGGSCLTDGEYTWIKQNIDSAVTDFRSFFNSRDDQVAKTLKDLFTKEEFDKVTLSRLISQAANGSHLPFPVELLGYDV